MEPPSDLTFVRLSGGWRAVLGVLGLASVFGAAWLSAHASPSVSQGVAAHTWPAVEAEFLEAGYHSEAVPNVSMDTSTTDTWVRLKYAYTTTDAAGRRHHHTGNRYDASTTPDVSRSHRFSPSSRGMASEVTAAAPRATVRVDPADADSAVFRPGLPYESGLHVMLVVGILGLGWMFTRAAAHGVFTRQPTDPVAARHTVSDELTLVVAIVYLLFGFAFWAFFGLAVDVVFDVGAPGWPLCIYALLGALAFWAPRILSMKPFARTALAFALAIPILIGASLFALGRSESDRFAYEVDDSLILDRLTMENPAILTTTAREVRSRGGPPAARHALEVLVDHEHPDVADAARHALFALPPRSETADVR